MILVAVIAVVLLSMALVVIRALLGPSVYDRMLAANVFGTLTVILIALIGLLVDNTMFLDVALIYALVNFVATVAFLRYGRNGKKPAKSEA